MQNIVKTKKLVGIAVFTALVVVLQYIGSAIKFGPFSISLVLVPIVVGAALFGYKAGIWLGLVFGAVVLISGDAAAFLAINVPGTIIVCLVKGLLAGCAAGLVYKALEKKSKYGAVISAAVVCPVVNTGVFLIGCAIFFMETINGWAQAAGFESAGTYMIVGLVGVNFLFEMAVNIILSPVIIKLIEIGKKMLVKE
ncbi:MAG: ECF transporter S component [Clostridiales bacterium]|nr:ECF transporter S component [Clostridiales bacterium]